MPYETPQFSENSLAIPLQESLNLVLTPKMITTSEELRSYSPTKRNCYFSNEGGLKYFKQYTQSNCEIECLADAILKNCGCLPIYIESDYTSSLEIFANFIIFILGFSASWSKYLWTRSAIELYWCNRELRIFSPFFPVQLFASVLKNNV
jgi:Amiloride-sensitive sodium channel